MKRFQLAVALLFITCFFSCEEVVEIDLDESAPRLVVEGSLYLPKNRPANSQIIKLSTTAPFFSEEIPPATGAIVRVTDDSGGIFDFREIEPGIYKNSNLKPHIDGSYTLEVTYNEETYQATETFVSVPRLESIEQTSNGGFGGGDIELKAFYSDPPELGNYYFFRFLHQDLSIQIIEDKLINGNLTFAYFTDENLEAGDEVRIEIHGISQRFYEYMFILRSQAGSGGGPFQTQPTTVKGNLVNTTNPDNFALGYFRVSETHFMDYRIQ